MQVPIGLLTRLPYFGFIRKTLDYQGRISFNTWLLQKVLNVGGNRDAYWPVHWTSKVYDVENILVGVDAYHGIMPGCYIQGKGGIIIGDYTQIGPQVTIVSANHDLYDTRKFNLKEVKIGKYCWIGAGASIMPGTVLGDWTIVGAGAVVSGDFGHGYCVLAGVPAKVIKMLDRELCIGYRNQVEYVGYVPMHTFDSYRKKYLNV